MTMRLTVIDSRNPGVRHFRGFVQDRVVIGRAGFCDVCLPDLAISSSHAEIRLHEDSWQVQDLGSLNGTIIAGRRLIARRPRRLQSGDALEIGAYRVVFEQGSFPGTPLGVDDSNQHAREMLKAILTGGGHLDGKPVLQVFAGPCRGARYALPDCPSVSIIGRAREHGIRLDDPDVSRVHAEVILENDIITVRDLRSHNGVLINGARCAEFELVFGQTFTVGNSVLGLENPLDPRLFAIQNAPEEETASFTPRSEPPPGLPTLESIAVPTFATEAPMDSSGFDDSGEAPTCIPPLPIGPEDPFNWNGAPGYVPTAERPLPPLDQGTDIGLIIVGAIIVAACVSALLWMFA